MSYKVDMERTSSLKTNGSSETDALLPRDEEAVLYNTISSASSVSDISNDRDAERTKDSQVQPQPGLYGMISVLLLGSFVSQIDLSFVMATYGQVGSEFNALESATWLVSAYVLAQCVVQPLYGKLSDIYGRKSCLQASYFLFMVGTIITGCGTSMTQVIVGRSVQGTGGAGMLSMVHIIITDLVPMHDVARLRSYVNIIQTGGRSCGGVIGGLLTQTLGWRWAFLVQVPPTLLAALLVQWKLKMPQKDHYPQQSSWDKLKRVDFLGAFFLCYAIFASCFVLDSGGQKHAWNSPIILAFIISGVISILLFVISAKHVPEPIFPLRLAVHVDVVTNYLILFLQVLVQFSLMMSVPIYFQAVRKASTAEAGLYLIPAFIGNMSGGLLAGYWIRKTGRYKIPTVAAPMLSICAMCLTLVFWNGGTSPFQCLAAFPGGFAQGMVANSAFVGIAARLPPEDVAIAASGMYLFFNIGTIAGASAGSATFQGALRPRLNDVLSNAKGKEKIIRKLLNSIDNVQRLSDRLREIVLPAYVQSFHAVSMLGLFCAGLSLTLAVFSRSHNITKS